MTPSDDERTTGPTAEPDLFKTMRAHRSIRRFRGDPVPQEHIARAVRAAQQASTSSWVQAYALLEVTDPAARRQLRELTGGQAQVEESGAFFCVCGDVRRHALVAADAGESCEQNLETFLLAAVDASLFAQNLVLAFEAQGYGICYIGGLRTRLSEVDALLELPDGVWPFYGLCVGVPDESPAPRPRLPLEAVWFQDRYPDDARVRALIAEHDEAARRYYDERGQSGRDWSGGIWRKFRSRLREDLKAYYESKGAVFE